ncbi:hypothetical protein [Sharpea azabuensis]|uniref:hypothetical protein n=1 Tax=Sharpea azabuensis TaxID=322505 RepID=UPI0013DB26BF|nr:hypothetical protein [Sharpea azabuensis]
MNKLMNKKLNLLEAYEQSFIDPHRYDRIKKLIPLMAIALVLLAFFITMTVLTRRVDNETANVNDQIKTVQRAINQTDKGPYQKLDKMQKALSAIKSVDDSINSLIKFDKATLNDLLSTATRQGVTITSITFNQQENKLTIGCTTATATKVTSFVKALREDTNHYDNISYTGYSEQVTQTASQDQANGEENPQTVTQTTTTYNFQVSMKLVKEA